MTTGDEINEDLPTIAEDLVVTKYKMAAEIVHSKRFTFTLWIQPYIVELQRFSRK